MAVYKEVRQQCWIAANRIRAHYLEMPGLSLTEAQAWRLLGLDPQATTTALRSLERDGFLLRTRGDQFVLRTGVA